MNTPDDYRGDMDRDPIDQDAAGGPLSETDLPRDTPVGSDLLVRFLTDLSALGDGPAPPPSAELEALLDGTPLPWFVQRESRTRHRRRIALAAAAAIAGLGLTGVAAAHGRLPQPAQRYVSRIVNDLTPFHVDPSRVIPTPHPLPSAPGGGSQLPGTSPPEGDDGPTPGGSSPGSQPGDGAPEPSGTTESGDGGDRTGGAAGSAAVPGGEDRSTGAPSARAGEDGGGG